MIVETPHFMYYTIIYKYIHLLIWNNFVKHLWVKKFIIYTSENETKIC